ncbi:hypothetical protein [Oceanithermus sp.]|uniref:hypothetical protein n=1 Tax=Oceanithermus sp. TaxID=2268145 RepID=UPI0025D62843|nr:hypothetical protein [Oceanithermus sp.]
MGRRVHVFVLKLWRDADGVRIELKDAARRVRYFPNLERLIEHLRRQAEPPAADPGEGEA